MPSAKDFEKYYKVIVSFDKLLGMELTVNAPGDISYRLEINENHLSSPDACHGGVIAAFMDAVIGLTALTWSVSKDNVCSTVEFKINYLNRVSPGDILIGTGEIDFTGSKLIVANGVITEEKSGKLVAKGLGTFSRYPLSKKNELVSDLGEKVKS